MRVNTLGTVRNALLASLPPTELAALLPKFRLVTLHAREVVCRAGERIEAVHFPETGLLSMVASLDDGLQAEVGMVGCEGMTGTPLVFGVDTSFPETIVQVAGSAWRMEAGRFRHELEASASLWARLVRYSEAFQAQTMQTAACNGRHRLEQRLARWLLMAHDRAQGFELPFTHDTLAMALGVHRPSVTIGAKALRQAGLIQSSSGMIRIVDRAGLEAFACDCYRAVQHRFATLLAQSTARDPHSGPLGARQQASPKFHACLC